MYFAQNAVLMEQSAIGQWLLYLIAGLLHAGSGKSA